MAIAFDAAGGAKDNSGGVTSLTFAHTTSAGSDRLMVVTAGSNTTSVPTVDDVKYNGDQLIEVDEKFEGTNVRLALWYMVAPDSGTNNVVVTWSGTGTGAGQQLNAVSQTYTGASQTGQPDSNGFDIFSNEDPFAVSTTVVASNCWLAGAFQGSTGEIAAGSPVAPTVQRGVDQFNQVGVDTNGVVGTGAQTINWDAANPDTGVGLVISIAPAGGAAAAGRPIPYLNLLGVGT